MEKGRAGRSEVSAGPVADRNARWSRLVNPIGLSHLNRGDGYPLGRKFCCLRAHLLPVKAIELGIHWNGMKKQKVRAADAKEVGVENPAEETCCHPNQNLT